MKWLSKQAADMVLAGLILNILMSLIGPGLRAAEPKSLEARLKPLIDAHRGRAALAVKHLASGEAFAWHEHDVMPTASLIKFPVLIELYARPMPATSICRSG